MDGVNLTSLKQIYHSEGNVFHAMKKSDEGFEGFGEAYFSSIGQGNIKGWKKHTEMVLNLIVPIGEVELVIYNEKSNDFFSVRLSQSNYQRLTVSPNLWMAFRGISEHNMLLNLASIEHDPSESMNKEIDEITYGW